MIKAPEPQRQPDTVHRDERDMRLELLFERAFDPMLLVDPSDRPRIINCNHTAENFFEVPGAELIGTSYVNLVVSEPNVWESIRAQWAPIGVTVNAVRHFRRHDGIIATMDVRAKQLREDFSIIIMRDITEQQLLEQQQNRSQRLDAIDRLAGGGAHDFNNFLAVINGNSEFALNALEGDHPAREAITGILEAGNRSATVVRQFLAFSQQAADAPATADINAVITALQRALDSLLDGDIERTLNSQPTPPRHPGRAPA